MFFAHTQKEYT
jgi:hypothetical protein